MFLIFLCFLLVILLFKMAPKVVLKHTKAVLCLMEKTPVLNKLLLGMINSAVGREFSVNESRAYIK